MMNQVVQELMTQLDKQDAFFEVEEVPVAAVMSRGYYSLFPNRKAIVRKHDGALINIVSKNYRLLSNEEMFSGFLNGLVDTEFDMEGARARVRYANNGGRTLVDIRLPQHQIEVKIGDITELVIQVKNGYDGLWAFVSSLLGMRLWCLNGAVFPDRFGYINQKHNQNLSVERAVDGILDRLEGWTHAGEEWSHMLKTPTTDDIAWRAFLTYNKLSHFHAGQLTSPFEDHKLTSVPAKMMNRYLGYEKPELGENAYAVYNTITHHSTHSKQHANAEATSTVLRNKKVIDLLESDYWTSTVCPEA